MNLGLAKLDFTILHTMVEEPYVFLYQDLHSVYMDKDYSKVESLLYDLKAFQSSIAIKWKKLIFK